MEHLFQLRVTDSLHGTSLLDIGARDTKLAAIVKNEGFSKITLIDKNELIDGNTSEFEFIQTDLETFQPEIKYLIYGFCPLFHLILNIYAVHAYGVKRP